MVRQFGGPAPGQVNYTHPVGVQVLEQNVVTAISVSQYPHRNARQKMFLEKLERVFPLQTFAFVLTRGVPP